MLVDANGFAGGAVRGAIHSSLALILMCLCSCSTFAQSSKEPTEADPVETEPIQNDSAQSETESEVEPADPITATSCRVATPAQRAQVTHGAEKKQRFLNRCHAETSAYSAIGAHWCEDVIRPNPLNEAVFHCIYGQDQPYLLIHPSESTWRNAIEAVKLVMELEASGICVSEIYNWWRPEPYNKAVGGAAGRHPFGTSVDVRFCEKSDQERAHFRLCQMRRQGRLRALGYYETTALHLGVGDQRANTWGKSCP